MKVQMKRFAALTVMLATLALGPAAAAADFPEARRQALRHSARRACGTRSTRRRGWTSRGAGSSRPGPRSTSSSCSASPDQFDFRGDGSWRISKRNYIDFGYSR